MIAEHTLYSVHGLVHVGLEDGTLVPVLGDRSNPVTPTPGMDVVHIADPGTREWTNRMTTLLTRCNVDLQNERSSHRYLRDYNERLGQALLEKAEEKEWCSEYDEFADEWDLPRRTRSYEVNVQFTVTARDDDEAEEMVRDGLTWSFDVEWDPSVSAREA